MGRKSKAEERLGMTFINNEGCKFFIRDYINKDDIIVKFVDDYGAEVRTTWQNCKNGRVKNPYFTSIFGVGCLGEGDFVTSVNGKPTKEYNLWREMLRRCYSDKYHKRNPTYANVTVCERWLCFANFLEDLPLIENYELWLNSEERISLDKDLKQSDVENKIYSLDTVKFITVSENTKEAMQRKWSKQ